MKSKICILWLALFLGAYLNVCASTDDGSWLDSLLIANKEGKLDRNTQMYLAELQIHESCILFREGKLARAYVTYVDGMKTYPLGLMQLPPAAQLMSIVYYWWVTIPLLLLAWWGIIRLLLKRDAYRARILGVLHEGHYREEWQKKVVRVLNRRQRRHDTQMLWPFYLVACFGVTVSFLLLITGPALGGWWLLVCAIIAFVFGVVCLLPQFNVKELFDYDYRQHVLTDLAEEAMDNVIYCPVKNNRADLFFQNSLIHTQPKYHMTMSFEFNIEIDETRVARLWEGTLQKEFSFLGRHIAWYGRPLFNGLILSTTMEKEYSANTFICPTGSLFAQGIDNYKMNGSECDALLGHDIYTTDAVETKELLASGLLENIAQMEKELDIMGYKRASMHPEFIVIAGGRTLRIFIPGARKMLKLNRRKALYIYDIMEEMQQLRRLTEFCRTL